MEQVTNEIIINEDSAIGDIQNKFTQFYPFLKIEFLQNDETLLSSRNKRLGSDYNISRVWRQDRPVKLNMRNNRTISELEHDCKEILGLYAKVFRKSGKVWNVISYTNNWTLEIQNKAGEFICKEMQQHTIKE